MKDEHISLIQDYAKSISKIQFEIDEINDFIKTVVEPKLEVNISTPQDSTKRLSFRNLNFDYNSLISLLKKEVNNNEILIQERRKEIDELMKSIYKNKELG